MCASKTVARALVSLLLASWSVVLLLYVAGGRPSRTSLMLPWREEVQNDGALRAADDGASRSSLRRSASKQITWTDGTERAKADDVSNGTRARLAILVKTGPQNGERRRNVRYNWADECSLGFRHKQQTGDPYKPFDFTKKLEETGDTYFQVPGHVYVHKGRELEVICIFITGAPPGGHRGQSAAALQQEFQAHGDIMVGSFSDGYDIMTAKTMWMMDWSLDNLQYDYVMLIDDDATIIWRHFVPLVLSSKREQFYCGHKHAYKGVKHCEDDTAGEMLKKNCVSWKQYAFADYPPFASGFAYYMSRDVARLVVRRALLRLPTPGLPGNVEDAMVGVLANESHVSLTSSTQFLHYEQDPKSMRCLEDPPPAVIGNAPTHVLNTLTAKGKAGERICMR